MKYYLDTEFHEYKKQPKVLGINVGKPIDTIELISIGMIAEDDREYYAICNEFNVKAAWDNEWLRENVLRNIFVEDLLTMQEDSGGKLGTKYIFTRKNFKHFLSIHGKSRKEIEEGIKEFCTLDESYFHKKLTAGESVIDINPKPEFYAYYADYDWVVFCWLFGRMMDLPKGFPMYCKDLKQMKDDLYISDGKQVQSNITDEDSRDRFLLEVGYPKQTNEHNALADAKWNKELHKFIESI